MNQIAEPLTLDQIKALPNTYSAKSQSQAYSIASEMLPNIAGPIASKKMLVDKESGSIVYSYYRARNKDQNIYVIF